MFFIRSPLSAPACLLMRWHSVALDSLRMGLVTSKIKRLEGWDFQAHPLIPGKELGCRLSSIIKTLGWGDYMSFRVGEHIHIPECNAPQLHRDRSPKSSHVPLHLYSLYTNKKYWWESCSMKIFQDLAFPGHYKMTMRHPLLLKSLKGLLKHWASPITSIVPGDLSLQEK